MTEQQLLRQAKRRLAILQHAEEVTGNVANVPRYYGISRQCFYTWQRRYEAEGLDGLRDRSSKPHFSPLAMHTDVVGRIVYLRQHYHFGPSQDLDVPGPLPRHLDLQLRGVAHLETTRVEPVAGKPALQDPRPPLETLREATAWPSGSDRRQVHRTRRRGHGEEVFPVHRDRTTAHACGCCGSTRRTTRSPLIQFLDHVLEKLPFQVEQVQTDNGAEFQSTFHWHVLDRGIRHVYIKPHTPRLNGKVERSHRIDNERFHRMSRTRRHHRRRQSVQRQAPRMGGLLQLPPTPRRTRWTNPLRKTTTEDHRDLNVTGLHQSHSPTTI